MTEPTKRYRVVDHYTAGMPVSHPTWATRLPEESYARIGEARSAARGHELVTGSSYCGRFHVIDTKRDVKVWP